MASRRERRRAKARLRDRYQHGTDARPNGATGPAPRPTAYNVMLPRRVHATKTSATHRELVILQRIDCGRPKGKRRIRYTTTVEWGGSRVKGPGLPDPKE